MSQNGYCNALQGLSLKVQHGTQYIPNLSADGEALEHDDYIALGVEALERLLGTASIDTWCAQHDDARLVIDSNNQATKLQGHANCPDAIYDDGNTLAMIEAKAKESDLSSQHTRDQICDYIVYLAESERENGKHLIVSVPYQYDAIARSVVDKARKDAANVLLQRGVLRKDEIGNTLAEISVNITTEIDGKKIPVPDGWENVIALSTSDDVVCSNGRTYPVQIATVSIADLVYDNRNNRIVDTAGREWRQDDIQARLLDDANVEIKNRLKAFARRADIIGARCIKEQLDVLRTSDGLLVVIDGNSRLAFCRDITARSASAPGYDKVRVKIYDVADGVSASDINYIKNDKQHLTVLPHETVQDARVIYRKVDALIADEKCPKEEAVRRVVAWMKGVYGERIVEMSYNTIKMLIVYGIDDKTIDKIYYAASFIADLSPSCFSKSMRGKGITRENVVKRLTKIAAGMEKNEIKGTYLSRSVFDKTIGTAIKPIRKSDAVIELLSAWCKGAYDDPDEFVTALKEAKESAKSIKDALYDYADVSAAKLDKLANLISQLEVSELPDDGIGYKEIAKLRHQMDDMMIRVSRVSATLLGIEQELLDRG